MQLDWQRLLDESKQADSDTLDFFLEESTELVQELDEVITEWLVAPQATHHTAAIKRVLHTLKGGARLTELSVLGDFTHRFESLIELKEIENSYDAAFFDELPLYLESFHQSLDIIQSGELKPAEAIEASTPTLNKPQPTASFIGHHTPQDVSDIDEDLLNLFLEEAEEQLTSIDSSVNELHESPEPSQTFDALKRALHTLKGGARLSGITHIGNISHDFETFIIQIEKQLPLASEHFEQLQTFYTELETSLNAIKSHNHSEQAQPSKIVINPADDALHTSVTQTAIDATQNFFNQLNEQSKAQKSEPIKVSTQLLENLVNLSGESSISRSRIGKQVSDINFSIDDMYATVDRLHGQLRRLEIETEAQILFRQEQVVNEGQENFDPLEMDRYTHMQQLSKSLIESASDLDDFSDTLADKMRDLETLILQQSRIQSEIQENLIRSQMVPFSRIVPRLKRIVRQTATELNKKVQFNVVNAEGEMDRTILDKIIAPLEHMLRNAVDHGIESPEERLQKSKLETGTITLSLAREGGEILLNLQDDGGGIHLSAVRKKAEERQLVHPDAELSDYDISQFILHPGFSTAKKVTQISGRGVGMDVVNSEIKQLGGTVEIQSSTDGTGFNIRLPFTVSINRALMVCIGSDTYAIPLNTIEGIVRVSPYELETYYQPDAPEFEYAGQSYNIRYLGSLLDKKQQVHLDRLTQPVPVVLIRSVEYSYAVQVDRLLGSQEVVVKSLGPQFSMVEGLSGATVLGDGSVVIILDMPSLIRVDVSKGSTTSGHEVSNDNTMEIPEDKTTHVMVVDDSVTVRKVTSRFLERQGMQVTVAKDGLDAINQLQEMDDLPSIMLLDIEMPRMDGFEVISRIRHSERLVGIPICMITSRTGEKHRQRALSLGADEYLGKPFQETQLLQTIERLTDMVTS